MDRQYFDLPLKCPVCDFDLTDEGSLLYCRNTYCFAKHIGSIKAWISKLGLLYWGDSLVDALVASNKISRAADLYDLSIADIAYASSGVKFASKCHAVLHDNKRMSFATFLSALNIPNLGIATANDLVASGLNTLDVLLTCDVSALCKVNNVGARTAESFIKYFKEFENDIRAVYSKVEIIDVLGRLSGKSFCVTGATKLPRKAIHKMVQDHGGLVKESVSNDLSYLISNQESTSSKSVKALKHGVKVITEGEFLTMVDV